MHPVHVGTAREEVRLVGEEHDFRDVRMLAAELAQDRDGAQAITDAGALEDDRDGLAGGSHAHTASPAQAWLAAWAIASRYSSMARA